MTVTANTAKRAESPQAAPTASAEAAASNRASVVIDPHGRRRIVPKQLEAEEQSNQFVCPLCNYVIIRPVMTTCSHLFCDICFRNWVADQVNKQKKEMPEGNPVPLIPCPQPRCNAKLRKKDIMQMDKADSTSSKVGAVQLLQRLRNNLVVRCVHHLDHFKHPFGRDAERVHRETGLTCKWVGDLMAYEEHVAKGCEIERYLGGSDGEPKIADQASETRACSKGTSQADQNSTAAAKAPPPPPKAGGPQCARAQAGAGKSSTAASRGGDINSASVSNSGNATADAAQANVVQKANPQDSTQTQTQQPATDQGEVRMARYDYNPRESDQAQIVLKSNDLVKIFEVTEFGWAAGVRLCKETMQEIGDAGWFPAGYLYPPDHPITK